MREKAAEFEAKFGMAKAFGCIDGTNIRIGRPICNLQEYLTTNHFLHLVFKQFLTFKGTLWILTADGLEVSTMPRYLQTHL